MNYADRLTGGRWVNNRGIQRWRPDPPPLRPAPDLTKIACHCGATVAQTCRTKNGHRTHDHEHRALPRICRCGAALGWKRSMCDDCRDEAARRTSREYKRQARQRLKEAS